MSNKPSFLHVRQIYRLIGFFFAACIVGNTHSVLADNGRTPIQPHSDLGIADINTGLEAAHYPNYHFFESNYQQAQDLGATWNRWKVDWSAVEFTPGEFNWSCEGQWCLPATQGQGNYFDYYQLAIADEARDIHSVVILAEIPECYQAGSTCNNSEIGGSSIQGLDDDIFVTGSGTTDDPTNPNINPLAPINVVNRWALFVYKAMQELGPLGVQHWQVMNEVNTDEYWVSDEARAEDYARVVEIVAKIITYRGGNDQIILGGLLYEYDENEPGGLNEWTKIMFDILDDKVGLGNYSLDAIGLHAYDRSKTSYEFSKYVEEYLTSQRPFLAGTPIWLTETGSNGCGDESFYIPPGTGGIEICPPSDPAAPQSRSTDAEQADYIIQSMAYAFSSPDVEKYFQFHLHDFCPYGSLPDTDNRYRPGYGLYRNWPGYDHFVGVNNTCAVRPYDGGEKLANQGLAQASRWLRDFTGYSAPVTGSTPAEFLIFPQSLNQRIYVAWTRVANTQVELRFYPSQDLSGGPMMNDSF